MLESAAPFRRTELGKSTGDFMPTWTGLLKRQRLKFVSTYWFDFWCALTMQNLGRSPTVTLILSNRLYAACTCRVCMKLMRICNVPSCLFFPSFLPLKDTDSFCTPCHISSWIFFEVVKLIEPAHFARHFQDVEVFNDIPSLHRYSKLCVAMWLPRRCLNPRCFSRYRPGGVRNSVTQVLPKIIPQVWRFAPIDTFSKSEKTY